MLSQRSSWSCSERARTRLSLPPRADVGSGCHLSDLPTAASRAETAPSKDRGLGDEGAEIGAQDVETAPESLSEIEISPADLGLHWPRLDADLNVPALLQGVLGSKHWMARHLGAERGRSRTAVKVAASRENGRKSGRPRKAVSA